MPALKRTIGQLSVVSCQLSQRGFSLVEILLSLFFIAALVTILLTTSGSFLTRRQSNLQSAASKIASKEIERLRSLTFSDLINQGDWSLPACDTTLYAGDLAQLPGGKICRDLSDYNNLPNNPVVGTTQIVQVTITVYFKNENDASQNVAMDTLVYQYGL